MLNYDFSEIEKEMIKTRRDLHQYPEEGWTEFRTTIHVIERLDELGVPYKMGKEIHTEEKMLGKPSAEIIEERADEVLEETGRKDLIDEMRGGYTGCIATVTGDLEGPTFGLRFDLDCNQVVETTDADHFPNQEGFASKRHGLMHACGHDGHTAMGLGIVRYLQENKDKLRGKVIIAFQPAEEGGRGANSLIDTGFLEGVDYFIATHIGLNAKRLGTVITGAHGFLCSDKYDVKITGKSSHAGVSPQEGRNALAAASTATLNILGIPRHADGSSRVNVGVLNAGIGRNVIPEEAFMAIETRGTTDEINDYLAKYALNICETSAEMHSCDCETELVGNTCDTTCDPYLVDLVADVAEEISYIDDIQTDIDFGAGEDVTYMMNDVIDRGGIATLILIGGDLKAPHHNGKFDYDEKVLPIGLELFIHSIDKIGKEHMEKN